MIFGFFDKHLHSQGLSGWARTISKVIFGFIDKSNQSLQAFLSLNKKISRLSRAELFYQQNNVPNPFDFKFTESTVMGYRLGISMGDGLVVNYIFKRMFRDTNGNGIIENSEAINLTGIDTSFSL